MKNRNKVTIAIFSLMILMPSLVLAISASVKAEKDYRFSLDTLRKMKIMVLNFGSGDISNEYDTIQGKFKEASESYYGQNFTESVQQFKTVKMDLIDLLEKISQNYLDRTKEILDSTSADTFDILIKYSKYSGTIAYFRKPFNPLYDVKPYNEKNYHLYHDKGRIEKFLKNGYRKYQTAKNIFEDPEIEYLKNHDRISSNNINFIISRYLDVIDLCREAKQYGIEIYKIGIKTEPDDEPLKRQRLYQKFDPGQAVDPIFDNRIPDEYKVDANDNKLLIHELEKKRLEKTKDQAR
jgi:hypothetical protein